MERFTIKDVNIGFLDSDTLPSYTALYEKLREYEDLEEQGKLLKLPCKGVRKTIHKTLENSM